MPGKLARHSFYGIARPDDGLRVSASGEMRDHQRPCGISRDQPIIGAEAKRVLCTCDPFVILAPKTEWTGKHRVSHREIRVQFQGATQRAHSRLRRIEV